MATLDTIEAQLDALDEKLDALEVLIESERSITQVCTVCSGAGFIVEVSDVGQSQQEVEVECWKCSGATKINWGVQEAL